MWNWLSELKDIFILRLKLFLSKIFLHFLWFFFTLVAGFIFHIAVIYMMDHENFSFKEIILSGNLLLFLMAITASIFIDNVVFGEDYLKKDAIFTNIFRKAFVGLFPIFIISSCTIFLVQGKTILLQQGKTILPSSETEFIFMMNIALLTGTLIYAVITRLSTK